MKIHIPKELQQKVVNEVLIPGTIEALKRGVHPNKPPKKKCSDHSKSQQK